MFISRNAPNSVGGRWDHKSKTHGLAPSTLIPRAPGVWVLVYALSNLAPSGLGNTISYKARPRIDFHWELYLSDHKHFCLDTLPWSCRQ